MKIKFLSKKIINRITAGEVIVRPASVVKELVENAIDAGSTKIDIVLEGAGKNLIIVSDNGYGMHPSDLEISVQPHTTSKLDEEDLLNIRSFGFRGEALPSIGAISKLSIISKEKGSDKAYEIQIIGGEAKEIKHTIHNIGTRIEVRDLFFATPPRLKFLRTDKTELNACIDIVRNIAFAHPSIAFSLVHDGKSILKLQARSEDTSTSIKLRIAQLISEDFLENAASISFSNETLSIEGYVAIPTFNRASSEEQFLFINKRPVKDKVLNVALKVAYQDYLARDRHPVAVLFLNMDPQLVDVNVHPTKSEVRFYDPNLVRSHVISSIKTALATVSHKASTTIAHNALGLFNTQKPEMFYNKATEIKPTVREEGKNFQSLSINPSFNTNSFVPQPSFITNVTAPLSKTEDSLETKNDYPLGAAKAQLHSTYIISQTEDSIIIVDQHAAHERLGYEKIKESINKNGLIKQRLLMPEIVELTSNYKAELLDEKREELSNLGLTIEKFGDNSIIITEVPSIVGDINISQLVQDISDHLSNLGENISLTKLIEHITETYACHYSIRAGKKLSILEMNELLRQMENTPFSGQCNHGRPTYIELKLQDIEKLFGR
jgi:DNA mismatch repair protein MutL